MRLKRKRIFTALFFVLIAVIFSQAKVYAQQTSPFSLGGACYPYQDVCYQERLDNRCNLVPPSCQIDPTCPKLSGDQCCKTGYGGLGYDYCMNRNPLQTCNTSNYPYEGETHFICYTGAAPDLNVGSITYNPNPISVGDIVTFSITVTNTGDVDVLYFNNAWVLDGINSQAAYQSFDSQLSPGESTTFNYAWTATSGTHDIGFYRDVANSVYESTELGSHFMGAVFTVSNPTNTPTPTPTPI